MAKKWLEDGSILVSKITINYVLCQLCAVFMSTSYKYYVHFFIL